MKINSIGVFCGSAMGNNEIYSEKAKELGKYLALNNIELIYGGASVGLMGIIADEVLLNNGRVIGVIPDFFSKKEISHTKIQELIYVPSMQERKRIIAEHSDAFIVMPGGFGTLDEMFEMLTFSQLDLHKKILGILNINNYYDNLINQIGIMNQEGFVRNSHLTSFIYDNEVDNLIYKMENQEIVFEQKWLDWAKE